MLEEVPSLRTNSTRISLAFAAVYLSWGSTYIAIHVAGEHLPVAVVSGTRSVISSALILTIALLRGKSLRVSRSEAWKLAVVGLLFMSANNMLLTWGETMVPSGFASLVIAMVPILVALIEVVMPVFTGKQGEPLNLLGWVGTLLGTAGIVVLVWPALHHPATGYTRPGLGVVVLLGAGLAFAIGSVMSRRFQFRADTFVATGWQIGVAGVFNVLLAAASGGFRRAQWTAHGLEAIVYLSIFGSLVGLVSFTYLLKNVAVTKVATYAFVNPVIAVLLGILLLGERLVRTEVAGMAIIVVGVATVVFSKTLGGRGEAPAETAA